MPSKRSKKDRELVVMCARDPQRLAGMALGFLRSGVLSRDSKKCQNLLNHAVEVVNLVEQMRREFIAAGDRDGLERLAAAIPYWPSRSFTGRAYNNERAEVERLPVGSEIREMLPTRISKPGRPTNEASKIANELLNKMEDIRSGAIEDPGIPPTESPAKRKKRSGLEDAQREKANNVKLALVKEIKGLPDLDPGTFPEWFELGFRYLKILAQEPDEEQIAEYRQRIRALLQHSKGDAKQAVNTTDIDVPLYPVGSRKAGYQPNRFAVFLDTSTRAGDIAVPALRRKEEEITKKLTASAARADMKMHPGAFTQELIPVTLKESMKAERKKIEETAKDQAAKQRRDDFEKTCRREWLRRVQAKAPKAGAE